MSDDELISLGENRGSLPAELAEMVKDWSEISCELCLSVTLYHPDQEPPGCPWCKGTGIIPENSFFPGGGVDIETWKEDCWKWHGRELNGAKAHWCPDFDDLPIDETCEEEMKICKCYD